MKVDIIQTSFAAGEFGPSLYGRTDTAQYVNACQIVENFLPRSYGPVISMPGTRYVATVSDSTLRTRLIKFVFNRTDAYVIETGDLYMRFFTNRGQVVEKTGTEDLSAFGSNLKAHWKCNDNTNSTTVLDATSAHDGTASTLTSSLSTTAIVSTGFDLNGVYHISVTDHADFTRTAATQPMTIAGWFYYDNNGAQQQLVSKSGEYELFIDSSDQLNFQVTSPATSGTVLLLHADGTDGSTTFTDSSDSVKTVTANGNAQIDTAQSKFGGASALFDGTGDYLSSADSADWSFGTGDLTIDMWVRFTTALNATTATLYSQRVDADNRVSFYWNGTGDPNIYFESYSGAALVCQIQGAWSPSLDTWYHVAVTKSGSDYKIFINGTQVASGTDASSLPDLAAGITIGAISSGGGWPGWIDEFRVIKGTAVWTSDFTVPSVAYQSTVTNNWEVNDTISEGWNFIGVVFKGDGTSSADTKFYIDGEVEASTFTSDAGFVRMADTTSLFRIGTSSSAGANRWADKIDNIAFIHQELSASQIAALYIPVPYQITTVFRANELFDIQYTQLNDIIWLSHPNHPPQELIRTSSNEWAISDFAFTGGPFLDDNTTATTIAASATTGTVNLTVSPTNASLFTVSGSTLGHHNSFWKIGGLAQTNSTTGLQEEGYVKITNVVNSYTATATVIKNLKVSSATTNWAEGAWSSVKGYPKCVALHERRLWYARTDTEPQKIWGSKVFEFENFHLDTEADDDGVNLALASNESNEIQWLASSKSLVAGTYDGAFVINSGSTEPITPDNANASEEVGYGSEDILPKKIGNFIYYIQRFGMKLREMFYFWDLDTYKAVDKTILSPHILGDGAIDMDATQNPETILCCVLTSGTLATMTREPDQEVTAWARHTTSGTYSSIAIIPSQSASYDEAWVIVERWVNGSQKKYVEHFENIEVPDQQYNCLYLHSALTYSAYTSSSTSTATISLSASSGSITLTSSTAYFNGGMINKRIRAIDANGDTIGEGTITATASTTSITLSITTTFNALSYTAGRWGVSVSSVLGLEHLEAKTLGILADGQTESLTRTVSSGVVTLGSNYFVIQAGLSYNQLIYTLPKEAGTQRGTAQGKLQRYSDVSFKLNRSTQGFKYGTDSSNLDDANLAFTPTVTSLFTGIIPPQSGGISMRGGYFRGAQIYIKNSNPLPIELLNVMGTLDTYEK